MQIKLDKADGHFPASDLQENTKEIIKLKESLWSLFIISWGILFIIGLWFLIWALPVFRLLVNRLLSVN